MRQNDLDERCGPADVGGVEVRVRGDEPAPVARPDDRRRFRHEGPAGHPPAHLPGELDRTTPHEKCPLIGRLGHAQEQRGRQERAQPGCDGRWDGVFVVGAALVVLTGSRPPAGLKMRVGRAVYFTTLAFALARSRWLRSALASGRGQEDADGVRWPRRGRSEGSFAVRSRCADRVATSPAGGSGVDPPHIPDSPHAQIRRRTEPSRLSRATQVVMAHRPLRNPHWGAQAIKKEIRRSD